MKNYKVRFNLSRGENYKKWKINYPNGKIEYHNPNDVSITMFNCELKNNRKTAEKIYSGQNKSVCAWVTCKVLYLDKVSSPVEEAAVAASVFKVARYNPKIKPHWFVEGNDKDFDNNKFIRLFTIGKSILFYAS